MRTRPTLVEPVNVSFRTFWLEQNSPPISRDFFDGTMLNTPGGIPARSASTANAVADNGVIAAGFATIAHPVASAGATLRVIMAFGKFHGVMDATTPTGCFRTMMRRPS